jgi:hypothetical protein
MHATKLRRSLDKMPHLQAQSCQGPQQSTTRSFWQDFPFLIPLALRLRDLIKDARRVREYAEG